MPIDRCICFNVTFAELKAWADRHHGDLEQLRSRFGCGRGCALCVPYLRAMLTTGQTTFSYDSPDARIAADDL